MNSSKNYQIILISLLVFILSNCADDAKNLSSNDSAIPDKVVAGVNSECGSVRMTQYKASPKMWEHFL